MKISIISLSIILLMLVLAGCTGNAVYLKTDKKYDKTDYKNIKIYSITNPSENYEIIGYVSTYSSDANREGERLRNNLKKQAAKYGADAIIGFKLNIAISGGGGAQGVAVKFLP
ncbi:MAG: hypothetical protein HY964_04225 [Ignavibacteriales bacterium]|nr:hypothetical protein [Ignavibacteriales bacterium]